MSTAGSEPSPTTSPLKSIGASSFSPSPMMTVPVIWTVPRIIRMASTAAPSAASLSPRPTQLGGGQRSGLGRADELHGEVAVGSVPCHRPTLPNGRRRHGTDAAARWPGGRRAQPGEGPVGGSCEHAGVTDDTERPVRRDEPDGPTRRRRPSADLAVRTRTSGRDIEVEVEDGQLAYDCAAWAGESRRMLTQPASLRGDPPRLAGDDADDPRGGRGACRRPRRRGARRSTPGVGPRLTTVVYEVGEWPVVLQTNSLTGSPLRTSRTSGTTTATWSSSRPTRSRSPSSSTSCPNPTSRRSPATTA